MKVAEYLIRFFESRNIDTIFLLSGGGMMHLLDAVARSKKIKYICHHHEQTAGMAAEGYCKAKNDLGVCFATSGPGGTNLVTAIAGAWVDSSPVIFVTGQSKLHETMRFSKLKNLRQKGTFEVDILSVVKPITKYSTFITHPNFIATELEKAYSYAISGRPGPVLIDIPLDIQGSFTDFTDLKPETDIYFERPISINKSKIQTIFEKLANANRPLIYAGNGVHLSKTSSLLIDFVKKNHVPLVTTPCAKNIIPYDHPNFVGHVSLKGNRAANFAIQSCDFMLIVGNSLHPSNIGYDSSQFAPQAHKVLIDICSDQYEKNKSILQDYFQENLTSFFNALSEWVIQPPRKNTWLHRCQTLKSQFSLSYELKKVKNSALDLYAFIHLLNEQSPDDCIIVTDAGSAYYVVGQSLELKKGQTFISSAGLGAMGYALAAATGAACAYPQKNIICITGDGSLMTNLHELAVIQKNQLNIKIFVINNQGYSSIRNTQATFMENRLAGVDSQSGVNIPNLRKIADTFCLPYKNIRTLSEGQHLLKAIFDLKTPVFIDVLTSKIQKLAPTIRSKMSKNGGMKSDSLEHMYPYLSPFEMKKTQKFMVES